jgi:hypothetical protein
MRRKNRKWVALAAGLYLLAMVSAYRWAVSQRIPEGNIFNKIEHEGIKRLDEEKAEAAAAAPKPTGESRLAAAAPAIVAARYDATHVVFILASETESRFESSPLLAGANGTPTRVPASPFPSAPLAGLQELWEPDAHSLHFFPKIIQQTQPGDQWTLSVSPDLTIPVVIDRPIIAPMGCALAMGFLASVPVEQQSAFAASRREYFVVRRTAVASADPPVVANIGEILGWKLPAAMSRQIEQQLTERMKQEVSKIDASLLANAGTPGETAGQTLGDARPSTREWLHADRGLMRGEGALDYDIRAFRLTPDRAPRLFVRARWKLASTTVFLMSAWFRLDPPATESTGHVAAPVLLFADSSWSSALRQGDAVAPPDDSLNFQTILNQFDADHDGWAELLVHSYDTNPSAAHAGGASTSITLALYTDLGRVSMKTPLHRDSQSPESCLAP